MHARVTTLKVSPDRVDEAFDYIEDTVRPRIDEAQGCEGIVTLASGLTGVLISMSFWESEEDMESSEELAKEVRSEGTEAIGFEVVSVERYEARVAGGQLTLDS